MPQFTKQALAGALKTMLQTKPLDKITVKSLVETCGINRQTFYYHFQDIYDLLGWIYRTEALNAIESSKTYSTWQHGLLIILEYVQENKTLCTNTYRSMGREHLEKFLNDVLIQLLGDVIDEIAGDRPLRAEDKAFITRFYCYAFAGVLLNWIHEGIETPCTKIVENVSCVMEGSLVHAVERFSANPAGHKKSNTE